MRYLFTIILTLIWYHSPSFSSALLILFEILLPVHAIGALSPSPKTFDSSSFFFDCSSLSLRSSSMADDLSDSFFLHHSDNPGLALVSQQLTEDNYMSWNHAMKIALCVKNKFGFVDGSLSLLDPEDDLAQYRVWMRNNYIVISWLLNAISKEILPTVISYQYASEIWSDLHDRFQQHNGPHRFQLQKEIVNLKQGNTSVSTYFTRLKSLWEEMSAYRPSADCACGGLCPFTEHLLREQIMQFLIGLDESFSQVRA